MASSKSEALQRPADRIVILDHVRFLYTTGAVQVTNHRRGFFAGSRRACREGKGCAGSAQRRLYLIGIGWAIAATKAGVSRRAAVHGIPPCDFVLLYHHFWPTASPPLPGQVSMPSSPLPQFTANCPSSVSSHPFDTANCASCFACMHPQQPSLHLKNPCLPSWASRSVPLP
jgi:hypothetical protein